MSVIKILPRNEFANFFQVVIVKYNKYITVRHCFQQKTNIISFRVSLVWFIRVYPQGPQKGTLSS